METVELRKRRNALPAHDGGISVEIDQKVLSSIHSRSDALNGSREIGGLLLGLRFDEAIQISKCTFPGTGDKSSKIRFFRNSASHQIAASLWWLRHAGRGDWVGEWHTHPERDPKPSAIDVSSWTKLVNHAGKPMVFVIVGFKQTYIAMMHPGSDQPTRIVIAK